MVAHNADFDMGFIMNNCDRLRIPHDFTYVDTVGMTVSFFLRSTDLSLIQLQRQWECLYRIITEQ